jgi:hypothetical protein
MGCWQFLHQTGRPCNISWADCSLSDQTVLYRQQLLSSTSWTTPSFGNYSFRDVNSRSQKGGVNERIWTIVARRHFLGQRWQRGCNYWQQQHGNGDWETSRALIKKNPVWTNKQHATLSPAIWAVSSFCFVHLFVGFSSAYPVSFFLSRARTFYFKELRIGN